MQQQGKGKILLLLITVILCLTAGFSLGFYGQQIRRVLHRHEKPYLVLIPENMPLLQNHLELAAIRWGVPVHVHKYHQFEDYALLQRENYYSMILHPQSWEILQTPSGVDHLSTRQYHKIENQVDRIFPLKMDHGALTLPFVWRLWTLESTGPTPSSSMNFRPSENSKYQESQNQDLNDIFQKLRQTVPVNSASSKNKSGLKKSNVVESSGPIWRWVHHLQKLETDLPSKAYLEILVWTMTPKTSKEADFLTEVLQKWSLPENQKMYLKNEWATCFHSSDLGDSRMQPQFLAKIPLQNIIPLKRSTQK